MKYLKQAAIIIIISFIGEVLNRLIPLPVPASIYGLVLMFMALKFKIFPITQVKETSDFLIGIMPVLFVPPSVSLILAAPVLKQHWWQFILIAVITTVAVMFVTGWVVQLLMRAKVKKTNENLNEEAVTSEIPLDKNDNEGENKNGSN